MRAGKNSGTAAPLARRQLLAELYQWGSGRWRVGLISDADVAQLTLEMCYGQSLACLSQTLDKILSFF